MGFVYGVLWILFLFFYLKDSFDIFLLIQLQNYTEILNNFYFAFILNIGLRNFKCVVVRCMPCLMLVLQYYIL